MNVILIGYRGSGKTTLGRRLADRLWQTYVDLDPLIVQRAGKTIREIFAQDGEAHFRDLEAEALRQALLADDTVISPGGGIILRDDNRALLRRPGNKVIYLKCDPAELLRRIQADAATADNRPALTGLGGGLEEIQTVLAKREPLYREVMTSELDVTHLSVDDAVHHISRMM